MGKPISADNPWILQSFVEGREWCTHTTARDGRVLAYVCCPSSAFQVNYDSVDKPEIEAWVRRFVAELKITGQVSFDFLERADGDGRAPSSATRARTRRSPRSRTCPTLAAAYLDQRDPDAGPLRPAADSRPTYWLYHELWRILADPRHAGQRLAVLARGRDAVYDPDDPLPFLLLHHLQIPVLLVGNLRAWPALDTHRLQHRQARRTGRRLTCRVLHLVGSPTDDFFADLSRLYAEDCLEATADPGAWDPVIAYVAPDGRWRFPTSLTDAALRAAPALDLPDAVAELRRLRPDVAVPQMFCRPGHDDVPGPARAAGHPVRRQPPGRDGPGREQAAGQGRRRRGRGGRAGGRHRARPARRRPGRGARCRWSSSRPTPTTPTA